MALTDLFGRTLETSVKGSDLMKGLFSDVKSVAVNTQEAKEEGLKKFDELLDLLREIKEDIVEEIQQTRKAVEDLSKAAAPKSSTSHKGGRHGKMPFDCCDRLLKSIRLQRTLLHSMNDSLSSMHDALKNYSPGESLKTLASAAAGGVSAITPPSATPPSVVISTSTHTTTPAATVAGAAGGHGGAGYAHGGGNQMLPPLGPFGKQVMAFQFAANKFASAVDKLSGAFDFDYSMVFKGVIKDEMTYMTNIRAAAFETSKFGESVKDVGDSWLKMNRETQETGYDMTRIQRLYQKQAQKGLTLEVKSGKLTHRTVRDQKAMIKNAAQTAYMVGSSLDETTEVFDEWQRNFGLTNNELASMGDHLKTISRMTGVSGDNLLRAAHNAQDVLKAMKRAGTLDPTSMRTILEQAAQFQKYGVEEFGGQIQKALTSWKDFMEAPIAMRSFLIRGMMQSGGKVNMLDIRNGTANSTPEKAQAMAEGLKKALLQTLGPVGKDIGKVENLELYLQKLELGVQQPGKSRFEQQQLAAQIKDVLRVQGLNAGEITQYFKALGEVKTPERTLEELQKKKTDAEAKGEAVPEKLLKGIKDAQQAVTLDRFNTFQGLLEKTGNTNEAMTILNAQLGDRGQAPLANMDSINATLVQGIQQQMKGLPGKEQQKALDALKEGGFASFDELAAKLSSKDADVSLDASRMYREIQNIVESKDKAQQSPMTAVASDVHDINATIRSWSGSILTTLTPEMLKGMLAAAFAAHVATNILPLMVYSGSLATFTSGLLGTLSTGIAEAGVAVTAFLSGPVGTAIAAVVGAYGIFKGLEQAVNGATNAATLLGIAEKDVNEAHRNAAFGANLLAGTLNALTFGIFDQWIGSSGVLTKAMAKFLLAIQQACPWLEDIGTILRNVFTDIYNVVSSVVYEIWGTIKDVWGAIAPFVTKVATDIWATLVGGLQLVSGILTAVMPLVMGFFQGIWDSVMVAVNFISPLFSSVWEDLKGIVGDIFGIVKDLWNTVASGVSMLWNYLKDAVTGIDILLNDTLGFGFKEMGAWMATLGKWAGYVVAGIAAICASEIIVFWGGVVLVLKAVSSILKIVTGVIHWFTDLIHSLVEAFKTGGSMTQTFCDKVTEGFQNLIDWIRNSWLGKQLGWADTATDKGTKDATKALGEKGQDVLKKNESIEKELTKGNLTDQRLDEIVKQKEKAHAETFGRADASKLLDMQKVLSNPEWIKEARNQATGDNRTWEQWVGGLDKKVLQDDYINSQRSTFNEAYGMDFTLDEMRKAITSGTLDAYKSGHEARQAAFARDEAMKNGLPATAPGGPAAPPSPADKAMKDMADEATKPGSIYTHDIHIEGLFNSTVIPLMTKMLDFLMGGEKGQARGQNLGVFDKEAPEDALTQAQVQYESELALPYGRPEAVATALRPEGAQRNLAPRLRDGLAAVAPGVYGRSTTATNQSSTSVFDRDNAVTSEASSSLERMATVFRDSSDNQMSVLRYADSVLSATLGEKSDLRTTASETVSAILSRISDSRLVERSDVSTGLASAITDHASNSTMARMQSMGLFDLGTGRDAGETADAYDAARLAISMQAGANNVSLAPGGVNLSRESQRVLERQAGAGRFDRETSDATTLERLVRTSLSDRGYASEREFGDVYDTSDRRSDRFLTGGGMDRRTSMIMQNMGLFAPMAGGDAFADAIEREQAAMRLTLSGGSGAYHTINGGGNLYRGGVIGDRSNALYGDQVAGGRTTLYGRSGDRHVESPSMEEMYGDSMFSLMNPSSILTNLLGRGDRTGATGMNLGLFDLDNVQEAVTNASQAYENNLALGGSSSMLNEQSQAGRSDRSLERFVMERERSRQALMDRYGLAPGGQSLFGGSMYGGATTGGNSLSTTSVFAPSRMSSRALSQSLGLFAPGMGGDALALAGDVNIGESTLGLSNLLSGGSVNVGSQSTQVTTPTSLARNLARTQNLGIFEGGQGGEALANAGDVHVAEMTLGSPALGAALNSVFGSSSSRGDTIGGVQGGLTVGGDTNASEMMLASMKLQAALSARTAFSPIPAAGQNLGIFEGGQGGDALSQAGEVRIAELLASNPEFAAVLAGRGAAPKNAARMQSLGLFSQSAGADALGAADEETQARMLGLPAYLTNMASEAFELRDRQATERSQVYMQNTGMFDDTTMGDLNFEHLAGFGNHYGRDLNAMPPTKPRVGRSGRFKGYVSSNIIGQGETEDLVARQVEGGKPNGPSSLLPGLEGILDYLMNESARREEDMIEVLEQIRDGLKARRPGFVSTPANGDSPSSDRSGLKNISREVLTGSMKEAMHDAYSVQSNHTGTDR